jgi:hypothetical protein
MTVLLAAVRLLGNAGAVRNAADAVQADRRHQLVVDALVRRLPSEVAPAAAPLAA